MSLRAHLWAWEQRQLVERDKDFLVLLQLADQANDEGECWPKIATLGRYCGISESTVRRAVRELEQLGLLTKAERFRESKQASNLYRLHVGRGVIALTPQGCHSSDRPEPLKGTEALSTETSSPPRARRERARDPLFDALAIVCGYDLSALTRAEGRRIGVASAGLRAAGATPEQVRERAGRWRDVFGANVVMTPTGIEGNWNQLASERERAAARFRSARAQREESA